MTRWTLLAAALKDAGADERGRLLEAIGMRADVPDHELSRLVNMALARGFVPDAVRMALHERPKGGSSVSEAS